MRTIVLFAALVLVSAQALGHARLVGSVPEDGATLRAGTDTITLRFSEAIQPRFSDFALHHLGDDAATPPSRDNRLPRQTPAVDAAAQAVEVPVPDTPRPGWYLLDWEVLAEDGHTTSGTLRFKIAE